MSAHRKNSLIILAVLALISVVVGGGYLYRTFGQHKVQAEEAEIEATSLALDASAEETDDAQEAEPPSYAVEPVEDLSEGLQIYGDQIDTCWDDLRNNGGLVIDEDGLVALSGKISVDSEIKKYIDAMIGALNESIELNILAVRIEDGVLYMEGTEELQQVQDQLEELYSSTLTPPPEVEG